ncbi:MAG: hypothetical protein NC416_05715 [Eubacterium sp.]|nr:hypothetical protein [Eubacterium sp.]
METSRASEDKPMNEQLKEDIRPKPRQRAVQLLILTVMGILFYLVMGQEWIAIEDDTPFYLNPRREGVMPVYPLFLFAAKCIFGADWYLSAVVVVQSILAIVCTMVFVLYLERQFELKWFETILLYTAAMLPFSIYLPESGITHQILTEGLAYAFFYLYFMLLLQYVFTQKTGWILGAAAMAAFMELIRSQMIFLLGVTAAVYVCVELIRMKKDKISRKIIRTCINCVVGVVGILIAVTVVYKIYGWYMIHQLPVIESWDQRAAVEQTALTDAESAAQVGTDGGQSGENAAQGGVDDGQSEESTAQVEAGGGQGGQSHENTASDSAGGGQRETAAAPLESENPGTMAQFNSLIITRGIYEVDAEDIVLFDSPEMKEIFQRVFDVIDAEQLRYVYARQDLYMWKDLVKDQIPPYVFGHVAGYLKENPQVELNTVQVCRELGLKALIHHFDRYLYHSFRMMVSGFISSVFFQIERIYFLCHIITLFLYLTAAAGIIYCLKKNGNRKVAAFALTTLAYIFLMVIVINLVFLGLQRYMVYAMGIFYCSLYLLAREAVLITAEGSAWIKKRKP